MIKYSNKKVIDVNDWDDLVQKTYDKPYKFQQQNGCKEKGTFNITIPEECDDSEYPDTVPEIINGNKMQVNFKSWLARDPKEWNGEKGDERFLDLFWSRNFYPDVQMIANDLHAKGLIEAGDYVIDIDW